MASKLYSMLSFMIATILLFNFAGIITSEGFLINHGINILTDMGFEYLRALIITTLAVGTASIVIGYLVTGYATNTWQINSATFLMPVFIYILADIFVIAKKVGEFNLYIATIIFAILGICWLVALLDWWRGIG